MVNLCRHLGLEPETALQGSNTRFEARFRTVEQLSEASGASVQSLGPDALEGLWNQAKKLTR